MTKVKVEASKGGDGNVMYCEVSGGESADLRCGEYNFTIGAVQAVVSFLTIRRIAAAEIKVTATQGTLDVEVDNGRAKKVATGKSFTIPTKAKRVVIKERVK